MVKEIWKDIEDYEGYYEVSNMGRVRSLDRIVRKNNGAKLSKGVVLKGDIARGYVRVMLHKEGVIKRFLIHRLVAKAFIPNPENKPQINHINRIKNDNIVENLEWCTQKENMQHAIVNNKEYYDFLHAKGSENKCSVAVIQYSLEDIKIAEYGSIAEASFWSGARRGAISNACRKWAKTAGGYKWEYKNKRQ